MCYGQEKADNKRGRSRPGLLDQRSLAPVGPGAGLRPAQKKKKKKKKGLRSGLRAGLP